VSKDKAMTDEEKKRREDERRWRDLGIKIIMGFEIMYREDNRRSKSKPDGEDSSLVSRHFSRSTRCGRVESTLSDRTEHCR
jgi:hypothetical protein